MHSGNQITIPITTVNNYFLPDGRNHIIQLKNTLVMHGNADKIINIIKTDANVYFFNQVYRLISAKTTKYIIHVKNAVIADNKIRNTRVDVISNDVRVCQIGAVFRNHFKIFGNKN